MHLPPDTRKPTGMISAKAASSQRPCLKFNTLGDLYPISIPHPEFITATHTHTTIIIFITLTSPTSLPKFYPRDPQYRISSRWPSLVSFFPPLSFSLPHILYFLSLPFAVYVHTCGLPFGDSSLQTLWVMFLILSILSCILLHTVSYSFFYIPPLVFLSVTLFSLLLLSVSLAYRVRRWRWG